MSLEKIPVQVQTARKKRDIEALRAMGRNGAEVKKKNGELRKRLAEMTVAERIAEAEAMIAERNGDPED